MNYIEITIKVPEGYEDEIRQLVVTRIEGILYKEIMEPSKEKKDAFNTEMISISEQNGVTANERFTKKVLKAKEVI